MTISTDQSMPRASQPLLGKKILITRAREQAQRFAGLLREYGAEPIDVPTIQAVPPSSWAALDSAIAAIQTYQWLIFTSAKGVEAFFARFEVHGRQLIDLAGLQVCAIGPATAHEAQAHGLEVSVIPSEYRAEAVVQSLSSVNLRGTRILLPRAAVARDILPRALEAAGAEVDVVEAYRTVLPSSRLTPEVSDLLDQGAIDVITFTSSSTVTNFVTLIGEADLAQRLHPAIIACIGPITAETVRDYGLTPTIIADEYTIPGLTGAIVEYFRSI